MQAFLYGVGIPTVAEDNAKLCLEEIVSLIYRCPPSQLLAKVEWPFLMARVLVSLFSFLYVCDSWLLGRWSALDQQPLCALFSTPIPILQMRNLRFKRGKR